MNFPLTPEALERIEGLTDPAVVSRLQSAIASITTTLVADGFEAEDIEAYLNLIVHGTIDDVIDDLA
jgi:hypothetical protein